MLNYALMQPQYRGKWQHIKPDGYYGPLTESAVKAFQYNHNPRITQTGIMGDTTYEALKRVGPSISTAPPYTLKDKVRTEFYLAKENIYTTFRSKYEVFVTSFIEPFLDEQNISVRRVINKVNTKLERTQFFKNLASKCTAKLRSDAIEKNPQVAQLRKEVGEIEKNSLGSSKGREISRKNKSIEKIIRKIKGANIVHPHQIAKKVTAMASKGAQGAAKWASVILDVCELVNYALHPHKSVENDDKLNRIFGKLVDDIILVLIGMAIGAGLAALGASTWPLWVAILVSVIIGFIVDSVYRSFCEAAGGDQTKPLSLSIAESISSWVNSPEFEKKLEPREMYIQAAPPKAYIQATPTKY